jgi:RNA polymerase-associated protein
MADVTLYEHPLSPYAQKCKIALREKGVAFTAKLPDSIGTGLAGGEFRDASPRIEVPALIHGGVTIFESTVILEYIEETWPDPALLPGEPAARAHARMLEEIMDTHYEAITWALGEIHFFRRATGATADRLTAAAAEQLAQAHAWLEKHLGDNQWFGGRTIGYADCAIAPLVNGAAGFDLGPKPGTPLGQWLVRANARPSIEETQTEAVASLGDMAQVGDLISTGQFKRQYRDHRLEWMVRSGGLDIVVDGIEKDTIRFVWPFA